MSNHPIDRNDPNFADVDHTFPLRDVSNRWTTALTHHGWTVISNLFLDRYSQLRPPITHGEAMFIVHVMQHKWDAKAPYPSLRTIARRMGVSTTSTRSMARKLERKGYVRREVLPGQTNRYYFDGLFKAIEEFQTPPGTPVEYATEEIDFGALLDGR